MIEIAAALDLVEQYSAKTLPPVKTKLVHLPGHVVVENLTSDVDSPRFDKSMMDGFALQAASVQKPGTVLSVVGKVFAGGFFDGAVPDGSAVQIMTGAPVPLGTDSVVMFEQTEYSDDQVTINAEVQHGQNILTRGLAMQSDQVVMDAGRLVRASDIGLLAEAGVSLGQVFPKPSIAVIATGDELVDVATVPTGSQIRNSNGPMLEALASPFCRHVDNLGIGPDDRQQLSAKIQTGLQSDVLVLSGGVSAGKADLVPELLDAAGVHQVFHKVRIKPGKPVWFGALKVEDGLDKLVFGLPGNPVSSMICFRVFVVPALLRMAGRNPEQFSVSAKLTESHSQRGGRTTYWPTELDRRPDGNFLKPLNWKGSADLKTIQQANSFGIFPGQHERFEPGDEIEVLLI